MTYARREISHQRGYTAFGVEHAKDNPAPDLKEFCRLGERIKTMKTRPIRKTSG